MNKTYTASTDGFVVASIKYKPAQSPENGELIGEVGKQPTAYATYTRKGVGSGSLMMPVRMGMEWEVKYVNEKGKPFNVALVDLTVIWVPMGVK